MFLQRKALYNLLQINLPRINSGELKITDLQSWQIKNYRQESTDTLFDRLNELDISFNEANFLTYADRFENPEEMADSLAKKREPLEQDQIFLLIFELWRRYFPEKRTLSIFCDEVDYQMTHYDLGHESQIKDTIEYFLQILKDNVDKGFHPVDVLQTFQTYCANDIESFLFDYILSQIEENHLDYASHLFENFHPYIKKKMWFDYLNSRLAYTHKPELADNLLKKLITQVDEKTEIPLVEEILYFLAGSANHPLFYPLAKKMFDLIKIEEDFRELLEICYIYYDHLDAKEVRRVLSDIFHRRKSNPLNRSLTKADPDLIKVSAILNEKNEGE
ncbi:MAG: hypothetical protein R3E91_02820 [Chlamydiales bacterium]